VPSLEAAFWVLLTAASACVFNQVLEQDVDALMLRTQRRPLVRGTIHCSGAIAFGTALGAAGVAGLAMRFHWLAALLALATLLAYALVYTPLKRISTLNTVVGALTGAMPPLLGYIALAGEPGRWGIYLFAVLFAWQFPHFMAIAWLHREDYARARLRMLPALSGTQGMAGRAALAYGLVLLPISILPAARDEAGLVYAIGAIGLCLAYAFMSARFALRETPGRARALLLSSLAFLPLYFSAVLLDPMVRFCTLGPLP
jgi:protoheme IX farnesyltransferase